MLLLREIEIQLLPRSCMLTSARETFFLSSTHCLGREGGHLGCGIHMLLLSELACVSGDYYPLVFGSRPLENAVQQDHSSTGKNQGRYAEISSAAALATAAAEETSVSPVTPLTTSEVGSPSRATSAPGQTPGRASDPKKRVPTTGGATTMADTTGGIGYRDNKNDSEVLALRQALKAAEKRARASENSLSQIEERRLREEARAQRLEERVAELEKVLSEQSRERQDA